MVDHLLEGGSGVLQTECHHLVAVNPSVCDGSGLVFIWSVHLDLVVARVGVHEAEQLVAEITSTIWPILGKGKLSFEYASLRLVKPMQTFYFLFFTRTGLASQFEYVVSIMSQSKVADQLHRGSGIA